MYRDNDGGPLLKLDRFKRDEKGITGNGKPRFALLDTKTGTLLDTPEDWADVHKVSSDGELLSVSSVKENGVFFRNGKPLYKSSELVRIAGFPPAVFSTNDSVIAVPVQVADVEDGPKLTYVDIVDRRTGTLRNRISARQGGDGWPPSVQLSGDGTLLAITYHVTQPQGGKIWRTEILETASGRQIFPAEHFAGNDIILCENGRIVTLQAGMPSPQGEDRPRGTLVNVYDPAEELLGDGPRGGNPGALYNDLRSSNAARAHTALLRARAGHITARDLETAGKNRKAAPIPADISKSLDTDKKKNPLASEEFSEREQAENRLVAYVKTIDHATFVEVRSLLVALTGSDDADIRNAAIRIVKAADASWAPQDVAARRLESPLLRKR